MSAAILPVSLTVLFSEALRGLKKVTAYTLLHGTLTPLLSICFVLLLGEHFDGVINGAVAYLCATTVVMLMAISVWYVVSSRLPTSVQQVAINKYEILSTSHSFFWVAIISVVMSFMETFVLGLFHDDVSVGLYAAALRMALIINFIIIAFNSILAPNFAALYRQGRLENIEVQARHSVVVMLTLTLPVVSLYCLLPTQVLSIFGEEFSRASTALIMLSVAQLINVFFGPVGILLQMTGHEKSFRNNVIISAFTTLVSALILIPPYDVIGASISALTGILLLNVLSLISVRRHLGINPLPLSPSSLSSRIDS
jgi:O-antigen/teichoic acid export membrane protein